MYQYTSDIWLLVIAALFSAVLGGYAWQRREIAGAKPYAIGQVLLVGTYLASILELTASEPALKVFWHQVWVLCLLFVPITSLALALEYAGLDKRMRAWMWVLLIVPLVITVAAVVSNTSYHMMWTVIAYDDELQITRSAWNKLTIIYGYGLKLANLAIFIWVFLHSRGLYRWQAGLIILGGLLAYGGQAIALMTSNFVLPIDFALLGSLASKVLVAFALFRFRAFDLVPVARNRVLEDMGDGMVVLDAHQRVVDLNQAAQRLLGISATEAIGRDAAQTLETWQDIEEVVANPELTRAKVVYGNGQRAKTYDVHVTPLTDNRDLAIGQVIVWRDVTESEQAQVLLLEQQRLLAILEERERLARELHDSLGQVLAAVNMQVETVSTFLERGDTEQASVYLNRLSETSEAAQVDVREYLAGTKMALSPGQDFFVLLQKYCQSFEQSYEIPTSLHVPAQLVQRGLDDLVEVQLLRIIQEALTNVRKHAAAESVQVRFVVDTDRVKVVITDDGLGFDPALASDGPDHAYGLLAMRERAQAVGGSFEINTGPSLGTSIIVWVPLCQFEEPML